MNHGLHVALGEKICFLKIFADIGKKLIDFTRIKHKKMLQGNLICELFEYFLRNNAFNYRHMCIDVPNILYIRLYCVSLYIALRDMMGSQVIVV